MNPGFLLFAASFLPVLPAAGTSLGAPGAGLGAAAAASGRPKECMSSSRRALAKGPSVWEAAREPSLARYCDLMARAQTELSSQPDAAKAAAIEAGKTMLADSLEPSRYAGHSLRAGFITSAAAAGVSTHDIMRHSQHKREETLRKYIRHATVFRQNAAAKVGL